MSKVNNISFQNNDIVRQYGKTDDGRLIVEVKDIDSDNYVKSTIPEENYDEFVECTTNIQGKYGKYLKNHAKKATHLLYLTNIAAATLGAAIAAVCSKKSSKTKTFFKTIGGALAGVVTSSVVIAGVIINKIHNMYKTMKNLDMRPYKEPVKIAEKSKTVPKSETKSNEKPEIKIENKKDENTEIKSDKQEEQ